MSLLHTGSHNQHHYNNYTVGQRGNIAYTVQSNDKLLNIVMRALMSPRRRNNTACRSSDVSITYFLKLAARRLAEDL